MGIDILTIGQLPTATDKSYQMASSVKTRRNELPARNYKQ